MSGLPSRLQGLLRHSDHPPGADDGRDTSRTAVLDGALASFIDRGIRRASMGDIAHRSGISPATLYRRFASKSAVVEAVGLREVRRFLADADDVVADLRARDVDAATLLGELAYAVVNGARRNRLLQGLLRTEPEIVLPFLTIQGAPVIAMGRDYLTTVLEQLQADGKLPAYDAAPVAEALARLTLSIALTPQSVLPVDDPVAMRAFLGDLLAPAMGPGAGPGVGPGAGPGVGPGVGQGVDQAPSSGVTT